MATQFSWIPFYREVVQVLASYEDRQDELLALLRAMKAQGLPSLPLGDEDAGGAKIELRAIDPFTFLATFHRTGNDARSALWKFLREAWHLSEPVPDDYGGLPTVDARNSWFFPYEKVRSEDDIPTLWALFKATRDTPPTGLDAALWKRALQIASVGVGKLTSGLFWVNPRDYLSLDGVMVKYLARFGIVPGMRAIERGDVTAYANLLARIHAELGHDHVHLSREAWDTRNAPGPQPDASVRPVRYWAGGHDWSTGSQLQRFLDNHEWQLGYSEETGTPVAQRLVELFGEIAVGDEFAIKGCGAQHLKVHALGRVREIDAATRTVKLEPLTDRPLYQGARPVGKGAGNWTESLLEVRRPEDIKRIFGIKPDGGVPVLPNFPLNTILYGPPGTGKTFNSVSRAVEIIDGFAPANRDACVARFEELRAAGRIGFVTFHQTFAYEEFIEGLRPAIDDDAEGGARYIVRDGIFKEMALRAISAALQPPPSKQALDLTFEAIWSKFVEKFQDSQEKLPGLTPKSRFTLKIDGSTIAGRNVAGDSQTEYRVTREQIAHIFNRLPAGHRPDHHGILAAAGPERRSSFEFKTTFIGAIIEELRRLGAKMVSASARPGQRLEITAKEFLSGFFDETLHDSAPRFVLIVDEINRGNISKIFGELITLLEDDKRLDRPNALRAMLPYSGETFALPSNLYVLGTMNTADKSLALLDIALRRRFTFMEMRPNFAPEVCARLTPDMRAVLAELNRRLMFVLDREHRLGHAFFMFPDVTADAATPDDFNAVFAAKIVPLLQEFFYNDWDGLRGVLGEKGEGRIVRAMPDIPGVRGRTRFAWWHDLDMPNPDFLAVLRLNYGLAAPPVDTAGGTIETIESP